MNNPNMPEDVRIAEALTPPFLNEDLSELVMTRIARGGQRPSGRRRSVLWIGAAGLSFSLLLSWWFLRPQRDTVDRMAAAGDVLVESARVGQQEARVFEFIGNEAADAKFFWFESLEPAAVGPGDEI